jgi:diaminopimelate decarboxylase
MNWWENNFLKVRNNRLLLSGREASALADEYGTPLYVYGKDQILANLDRLRTAFKAATPLELRVCYAVKANPNEEILRLLRRRGAWIDAVSPGEVRAALSAGFDARNILFTCTSVSRRDLREAFSVSGLTVNIDALEQLELMKEVRAEFSGDKQIRVVVRWNPGVGRGFSPRAVTAGERSSDGTPIKFGVEESKVMAAFEKAKDYGFSSIGLHQHLGSGWVKEDFETVKFAVDKMVEMASQLEAAGFTLEFVDFGGGFGPRYYRTQTLFPVAGYARHIGQRISRAGLKVKAVVVEPGKYLVGDAGVLLLRVEYVKESYGNLFACVDGGTYHTVPRPAIYAQARHEIVNASRIDRGKKRRVTIAGNLCETGDVFGRERLMPLPREGDILAVLCAGAYCRSMASNFNLREIPQEVLI